MEILDIFYKIFGYVFASFLVCSIVYDLYSCARRNLALASLYKAKAEAISKKQDQ